MVVIAFLLHPPTSLAHPSHLPHLSLSPPTPHALCPLSSIPLNSSSVIHSPLYSIHRPHLSSNCLPIALPHERLRMRTSKRTAPTLAAISSQDWGSCLITWIPLECPALGMSGRRPLKLACTQHGLCRQENQRCQGHSGCSTSLPRQMKLRCQCPPRCSTSPAHPSFGPSLRMLGLHLNHRPAACITIGIPTIQ